MKHAKHTPGPWYAERFTKDCEYPEAVLVSSTESYDPMEVVVFNNGGDYTPERQAADARLIASAPDLLEALQLVMRVNPGAVYINGVDGEMYLEWEAAANVIRKATGGTK